jgi:hypothetical protein
MPDSPRLVRDFLRCVVPATPVAAVWRLSSVWKMGGEVMGKFRDDPDFWRLHAQEARIRSQLINDLGSKRAAQEIADQYERIACRIEERMKELEKRVPAASALRRLAVGRKPS